MRLGALVDGLTRTEARDEHQWASEDSVGSVPEYLATRVPQDEWTNDATSPSGGDFQERSCLRSPLT